MSNQQRIYKDGHVVSLQGRARISENHGIPLVWQLQLWEVRDLGEPASDACGNVKCSSYFGRQFVSFLVNTLII